MSSGKATLNKTVALVGMMGAGKTSIGKRLAIGNGVLTVEDEDLEMENFRTVDAVAALVARKHAPRPMPDAPSAEEGAYAEVERAAA